MARHATPFVGADGRTHEAPDRAATRPRGRADLDVELDLAVVAAARRAEPLTFALVEVGRPPLRAVLAHPAGARPAPELLARACAGLGLHHASVYRFGGAVTALLLPGVGVDDAFDPVERMLAAVEATGRDARAGLVARDERCPDPLTLLIGADAALYEARGLGTGRVVASAGAGTGLRWLATRGSDARPLEGAA
jgi:hypothetical protein